MQQIELHTLYFQGRIKVFLRQGAVQALFSGTHTWEVSESKGRAHPALSSVMTRNKKALDFCLECKISYSESPNSINFLQHILQKYRHCYCLFQVISLFSKLFLKIKEKGRKEEEKKGRKKTKLVTIHRKVVKALNPVSRLF